jgi:ubiquinone/menaquinone biosynthesis C-methylase UbiE
MNDDLKRWDESASEWVAHFESKQQFKPPLVRIGIDTLIPIFENKEILDAGCGDGIYAKYFKDRGAIVMAVDGPAMIEIANKNNPGPEYVVADLLENLPFHDKKFDVLFSSMVLMQLSDITVFLKESGRVLKDQGHLIICVSHPCFTEPVMSLYKSLWDKVSLAPPKGLIINYFQKSAKERKWSRGSAKNRSFYPRTLEEYSAKFKSAGFLIDEILEPHELTKDFLDKYSLYEYATRIPRFIFFKLIKQ